MRERNASPLCKNYIYMRRGFYTMTKLTLKAFFAYVASHPFATEDFSADDVKAFANKQVEDIDKQYARRAEKRAAKRTDEKAELKAVVLGALGTKPMTLASLSGALANLGVEASVQKLAPLMKELAEDGEVERTSIDKRVAYILK